MRIAAMMAGLVACLAVPAAAQIDSMQKAANLGSVLGSEKACSLKIDQKAVEARIEKNVKANDMEFAGTLNMMTAGTTVEIKKMSAAQKVAHCTQITHRSVS